MAAFLFRSMFIVIAMVTSLPLNQTATAKPNSGVDEMDLNDGVHSTDAFVKSETSQDSTTSTYSMGIQSDSDQCSGPNPTHRLWLVSTRGLSSNVCCANLDEPRFRVSRVGCCGSITPSSLQEFLSRDRDRLTVIYVHGNRIEDDNVLPRSLKVFRYTNAYEIQQNLDWVIFSWPSGKSGAGLEDVRRKAARTDAHGLYLAWLLRQEIKNRSHITMLGYSFGGRMITGSLHALAGGKLAGRNLPGTHWQGAHISIGLLAPAIDSQWLLPNSYHGKATKNMSRMYLMYNSRDIMLNQFWRLAQTRNVEALGARPPKRYGLRADGSPLQVHLLDCNRALGVKHVETEYYNACHVGSVVAGMINQRAKTLWIPDQIAAQTNEATLAKNFQIKNSH